MFTAEALLYFFFFNDKKWLILNLEKNLNEIV